jgi:ATP-dependent helicase HrpA
MSAEIDPAWLETVAPHLCKAVYSQPGFNPETGFVTALKTVVSGGLTITDGQRVHYGPVDPAAAREIFIREGMVPGNLQTRSGWLKLHREMLGEIEAEEEKLRRPGSLLNTEAVFHHFNRLLPADVYSVHSLEQWIQKTGARIAMRKKDAVFQTLEKETAGQFPDRLSFGKESFPLHYTFSPGDELDGVALLCPADKLSMIPDWAPDWLVPGRLEEKVSALLRTLPKELRNRTVPLERTAHAFTERALREKPQEMLTAALARFLQQEFRLAVDAGDFDESAVPADLQMKIVETRGEEIVKVHTAISDEHRQALTRRSATSAFASREQPPQNKWPGGALPETVTAEGPQATTGWPALTDDAGGTGVRVFLNPVNAAYSHRAGLARLFRITQADQVRYVEKRPPLSPMLQLSLAAIDASFLTDLFDAAIVSALTQNGERSIRDEKTFAACAEEARRELYATVAGMAVALEALMEQREKIIRGLDDLPPEPREDIQMQLDFLFRPGFLKTQDFFDRYPRYLRAALTRIQRLCNNPAADGKKQAEIEPFLNRLSEKMLACKNLSESCDLIELAMLLEEYRINRFAPEIGTPAKVSEKRLNEAFLNCGA